MNKIPFRGVCTASITPFTENGIDFDALANLIEFQINGGVAAICFLGTTGEAVTVTEDEYESIAKFAKKRINGRVKFLLGSGGNCTATAVKKSVIAQKCGADGILVVTPYYNKCTQKGAIKYYKEICDNTDIPVICYNVPARTGFNLLPETVAELAEIKKVGGIKEACGNMYQICETARLISGKTALYSGDDNLNLAMLASGAQGVISVLSNICPREVVATVKLFSRGKTRKAIALQEKLLPLVNSLFSEVNPIPVKRAAELLGLCKGIVRAPLTPIEPSNDKTLVNVLKSLGFNV